MGKKQGVSTITIVIICVAVTACITGGAFGLGWWIGNSGKNEEDIVSTIQPTCSTTTAPLFDVKFGSSHYVIVTNEKTENVKVFSEEGDLLLVIDALLPFTETDADRVGFKECEYTDSDRVCVEFITADHEKARLTVTKVFLNI